MSSRRLGFAVLVVLLLAAPGCRNQPALEVEAAASATPASEGVATADAGAPALAPGATLPPGHPTIGDDAGSAAAPSLPAGHPPVDGQASAAEAVAGTVQPGGTGAQAIAWAPPQGWISEPPANNMRRAQYRVPGPRGEAECVVFYFGPGQGGEPQANAERWASQFVTDSGQPATSALKTRAAESNGMKVLFVETRGTYVSGTMAGGAGDRKPGYALLGAIVAGPDANWFFKMTGPAATIDAQRAAFESMVGGIQRGG